MKKDMSWITSVVRDLQDFCVKNDLQETAGKLSQVPVVMEREIAGLVPLAELHRDTSNTTKEK